MITPFRKYASETNQSVTAPSFESHIMVAGFPNTLLRLMSALKQTILQNQIDVRCTSLLCSLRLHLASKTLPDFR